MKRYRVHLVDAFVFLVAWVIFGAIVSLPVETDVQLHGWLIYHSLEGTLAPPPNFLYYLSVAVLSLFARNEVAILAASASVLSIAVAAKFVVTRQKTVQFFRENAAERRPPDGVILLFCTLLLFAFNLPTDRLYPGAIPPNIWHNSTTIFLMPFAIFLFWASWKQLESPTRNRMILISVLCVLNVLIKPSYFLVFVVAYPLMFLRAAGLGKEFWRNMIPLGFGTAALFFVYYLMYQLSFANLYQGDATIVVRPFHIWSKISSNLFASLISSIVFPLVYLVLYSREFLRSTLLQYAHLSYFLALVIWCLFAETGPREFHGNFFWQCVICAYHLFFVHLLLMLSKLADGGWKNWRNAALLVAFGAHVATGIGYLIKLLVTETYFWVPAA